MRRVLICIFEKALVSRIYNSKKVNNDKINKDNPMQKNDQVT